jgi:hypothetical protein
MAVHLSDLALEVTALITSAGFPHKVKITFEFVNQEGEPVDGKLH